MHCEQSAVFPNLVNDLDGFAHAWLLPEGVREFDEARSLPLLSDEERSRAMQFGSLKKRNRYQNSRVFLRRLLSLYTATEPHDLRFTTGPFGRPELTDDSELRFNLSHTGEAIACIVTRKSLCGIDIEKIANRSYDLHLAARVLATNEQIAIERTPQHMRTEVFLEYWTLKEAYAKAQGRGLSMEFDSVAFERLPNAVVRFGIFPKECLAWHFFCWRPQPEYVLAVAVKIA